MIPVYCPLCCDQPFEDQDGLFHHLRSLRNNLFCPICSERFISFDQLVTHLSRKCHGPTSPREAKRKCLFNKPKLPDTLEVHSFVSPSNVDSGNTQGEGHSERSPAAVPETTGVICNSVVTATSVHPSTIPPEIRNRLPRGVTLSLGPSENVLPSQKNNENAKPLDTLLENNKSVKHSPEKTPTSITNSLSVVLNKVSLNPNVEICVKPSSGSTCEKPVLSGSPSKNSPAVSIITNDTEIKKLPKQLAKAGPLSSKLKENNLLRKSFEDQSNKNKKSSLREEVDSLVEDEIAITDKIVHPKKIVNGVDDNSLMVNGVVSQGKSSSKTPVNKRRSRLNKINSLADPVEDVSNKSSIRTRGKKISYSKLLSSDDSDHFEDNASCSNDKDYEEDEEEEDEEEEEPLSSLKKNENSSNKMKNEPRKELDKKEGEITNEEPEKAKAEPQKLATPEKPHAESENSSSVAEPKTVEKEESKDSSFMEETKTEEEEEYTCSACNIRFTSIYEHIKEYHNGQEVVVEVPEEEIKEDLKAYQESSESLVSIGSEPTDTPSVDIDEALLVPVKEEKASPPRHKKASEHCSGSNQTVTKSVDKRKNQLTGFTAEGSSEDLVYSRTFKKVKKDTGEHWVQLQSDNKKLYQFVRDEGKYEMLMTELRNNTSIHPEFKIPVKKLFENPKINVVEITYQPNSPFLTQKIVNFKNPMPMFIVDREATNNPDHLGGIASYIMGGKESGTPTFVAEDSKVIGVMKVILANDKELTVENIVFNDKPANSDMVPVLEDVKTPDIPLLKDAKILKWRCNRCLATTWKFPLHKESHFCNACPICHKTFISPVSLKKHLVLHKRDGTKYCKVCQASFVTKATLNSHLSVHITHIPCEKCHLFIMRDQMDEHADIHSRDPSEQFPCSVCKKVFGSNQDLNSHEAKLCSKLVARFNCSQCDKKFFTQSALSYHTAAHTKAAIKLTCRFCPKTFIQEKEQCPKKAGKRKPSSSIQKIWHERIHTRDRPYMCKSCPKRFRSLDQEVQHSTKVHTPLKATPSRNVQVHMCTYCDRVFRNEKQLAVHMTQHTEAAPE